jgi:hypothetical protein
MPVMKSHDKIGPEHRGRDVEEGIIISGEDRFDPGSDDRRGARALVDRHTRITRAQNASRSAIAHGISNRQVSLEIERVD